MILVKVLGMKNWTLLREFIHSLTSGLGEQKENRGRVQIQFPDSAILGKKIISPRLSFLILK